MREEVIMKILEEKIIAIVRGVVLKSGMKVAKALYEGGIRLMEITLTRRILHPSRRRQGAIWPSASAHVRERRWRVPNGHHAGAGELAASAGAQYIIIRMSTWM